MLNKTDSFYCLKRNRFKAFAALYSWKERFMVFLARFKLHPEQILETISNGFRRRTLNQSVNHFPDHVKPANLFQRRGVCFPL